MNPEFLGMLNLKNSGITNLEPHLLKESHQQCDMQSKTGHDTQCNPNIY